MPGGAGCLQLALDSGQHKGGFSGTTVSTEAWGSPCVSLCSRLPAGQAPPWPGLWPEGTSHRTQAGQVRPSWPLGRSTGQGQPGPSVPPVAFEKGCASSAAPLAGGLLRRSSPLGHSLSATSVLFPTLQSLRDSSADVSARAGLRGVTRYRVLRERLLQ